ncbi:hypothetical protein DdX_11647 [Ditylenchus destructor]|uniref:Uncharacterized protein n=1 Tax=Ditylenchus destructor TaxID=166010 RepID=A0AAD4MX44_9BILA|nr:hypothetical protein DdX_11647 [Ditylenchus destructor]
MLLLCLFVAALFKRATKDLPFYESAGREEQEPNSQTNTYRCRYPKGPEKGQVKAVILPMVSRGSKGDHRLGA